MKKRAKRKARQDSTPKPNYPDCASGAIAYLRDDSTLNLTDAEALADPQVDGVWKVITPKDESVEFAIVYLAGYADPFGNIRPHDDFESIHRQIELYPLRPDQLPNRKPKVKCRCRGPKRHPDCQYCGHRWGGEVTCGECKEAGIDGKLIPGTGRVVCRKHKVKPGTRIRLITMPEDPDPIPEGTEGTVTYADHLQIEVDWDNGRALSLVPGVDDYEVLPE